MNKFKKITGLLLILISVIWSGYLLWSGFYQSVAFPKAGFPVGSIILPILLLALVLPVGVSYILSKNELLKAGKVAVWFHLASIIIIVLGFLIYLPCVIMDGNLKIILFAISELVAGFLYIIGLIALAMFRTVV